MPKPLPPIPPRRTVRRLVTIIEELEALPTSLEELVLFCPHHRPPEPMHPAGASQSATGETLVLYACADPGCRYREGWGLDPKTRETRRLIRGFDESRR